MNITRLNQFHAADGKAHQLLGYLKTVLSDLELCSGLISAQLLQSAENPRDMVLIEVWDSIKSHQDATRSIAPERVQQILSLLDVPAKGSYFSIARTVQPHQPDFETVI